jgi:bacillithiol system protein YtxJ
MGFLKILKDSQQADIPESWTPIRKITDLDQVDQASQEKPVMLFKHSVTCGISSGAKYRLESDWDNLSSDLPCFYLDLLNHRDVSNAIADRYKVVHQSPQILIISNGESIYDTSHHNISVGDINSAVARLA